MSILPATAIARLFIAATVALGSYVVSPEPANAIAPSPSEAASTTTAERLGPTQAGVQATEQPGTCEGPSDSPDTFPAGPNSELPRCNAVIPVECEDPYEQKWCACRAGMGLTATYKCGCKVSLPDPGEILDPLP